MPDKGRFIYWDSNVFLAYLNGEDGRVNIIDDLWNEIEKEKSDRIITSVATSIEVFCASYEKKRGKLDPSVEVIIREMFYNQSIILCVETSSAIADISRNLLRFAISKSWALRTFDALELATAKWVHENVHNVDEFHTYDDKLEKFGPQIGIKIAQPHVMQPSLSSQWHKSEKEEGDVI
ncbi:MAG TPA: type II toxin-antitoxin system VapC family toxin [Chloroflexota bacterium]|nr:type II toxin-antitoxin system VapC family toxin [Chloroflexota bacterium]HUM68232.1 type II toxin-antitoxin system VapC family toxin [Chloroflexota bacterium]